MGQINRKRDMTATAEINIDDIDAEAGAITPDQVTARCRTYEWKGKPIHAFSKTRSTAARCMGNALFLGRAKPDENGVWDELLFDAIMVTWLCVVDDSRATRACINKADAIRDMMAWWEAEGGGMGSDEEIEAVRLINSICEDIQTVSASVEAGPGARTDSNVGE
jgi:hypothetical protein